MSKLGDTVCEIQCHCFWENAQDGDPVKVWRSKLVPSHTDAAGKYVKAVPVVPCPECGRTDRVSRISFPKEQWGT